MITVPALSVVLVTPASYATLRKTVTHIRAQIISDQIELVLVTPSVATFAFDPTEREGFWDIQVVETTMRQTLGAAKTAGVQAARAPIVAFAEDHCYPEPAWAVALLAAHQGPWAAVGPAIGNANPASMVSWANLLMAYGHWLAPTTAREMDDLPGHNSSYKRDVLRAYGPELANMLEREGVLHADLRRRGERLYLEAAARAHHLNPTRAPAWMLLRFNAGRLFAAMRAQNEAWSLLHRLLYCGGAPLIPLIRLPQLLRHIRQSGHTRELLPHVIAALLVALLIHSLGEMAGYAFGEGQTREQLAQFEFDRLRQLSRRDRVRYG